MFDIEPLTERCGTVLREASHACIGVSPFNSYFSTRRLTELAGWALSAFGSCHFFVPDAAAAYTLEALGDTPERARHKAGRQGRYVRNKVTTALRTLGVAEPADLILGMDRLSQNARYRELLDAAQLLFETDAAFRAACLDASLWVLDRKLPPGARPTPEQLGKAVRYFLAELPLFTDSAGIAGAGARSSMFVYHHRVRFLERFYRGELTWSPAPGQGFLVVRERPPRNSVPDGRDNLIPPPRDAGPAPGRAGMDLIANASPETGPESPPGAGKGISPGPAAAGHEHTGAAS
ncbi:tRNA-dependent cyclodipeptide synthase [Streptomyces pactum]|uniref:Cyclodipeptide synthase n=1 Tax=Streptomyces pactum TaxID=68249 RepID=A0ABS0NNJ3_9ACTN|nr:tRNA-dependent cyclodipeptide synthase [Streptomyces pactum]MBH5336777.1 tRNA-dependent cyclodipeptide synthase [Streptomyces pactum]